MTGLMANAMESGAGELCRGRLTAACDEMELILKAHTAPGATEVSHLSSSEAARALRDTVRRFASFMDTGTHRSSAVAPPMQAQALAEAAPVAPFAFAAPQKKKAKRKRAPATAADLELVAASQGRWAAAESAGHVAPPAKKARRPSKA